jgi:hypothetical protein
VALLGLSLDQVRVSPRFYHEDRLVDDFGPNAPVEVQWNLAEVNIRMVLIHYDKELLDVCWAESMGGDIPIKNPQGGVFPAGFLPRKVANTGNMNPCGTILGNGLPVLSSGNHFLHLNLSSPNLEFPWRFNASYLSENPTELPLGTDTTAVVLNWRCIPYVPLFTNVVITGGGARSVIELSSSGAPLWDHTED